MKPITQQEITDYVEANIQVFHQKRLDKLQKLKLMNFEFITTFCDLDGNILWEEIVKFNSAGTTS